MTPYPLGRFWSMNGTEKKKGVGKTSRFERCKIENMEQKGKTRPKKGRDRSGYFCSRRACAIIIPISTKKEHPMKQERSFPQIFVTSKAEASIRRGHPWVYHTEITDIQGSCTDGSLADVLTQKGPVPGHRFFQQPLQNTCPDHFHQLQRPV